MDSVSFMQHFPKFSRLSGSGLELTTRKMCVRLGRQKKVAAIMLWRSVPLKFADVSDMTACLGGMVGGVTGHTATQGCTSTSPSSSLSPKGHACLALWPRSAVSSVGHLFRQHRGHGETNVHSSVSLLFPFYIQLFFPTSAPLTYRHFRNNNRPWTSLPFLSIVQP